jgi:hypothetical protein
VSELLIGCGSSRVKKLAPRDKEWSGLVTLDINPAHKPDVVHDLEEMPLPFEENAFSEIHAYEVLEHTGRQGDWRFFFRQWSEFWRLLEPDGLFCGSVPLPTSKWAWGDPSHTRLITAEQFVFLDQTNYAQVGKTAMSDFRFVYQADFALEGTIERGESLYFVLRAVKPSRIANG